LNNVVNYKEIPQWIPFMTHGTVAAWWYIIQGGILQNILLLSGSLFKDVNFLPLFYAGLYIDTLLLLVGAWLLGRRFFSSPFTVFFVALSIMGSFWLLQPWWNFHFYYAIPLILHLLHMFVDSGKWRYVFLAGNLLFVQSLGNLPYFLPVTSLVIFLYFVFHFTFNYRDTWRNIKAIRFGRPFVFFAVFIALLFCGLYAAMNFGTDQIVNYTARNMDGTSPLNVFLTYGGSFKWQSWLELVLGISPALDYSLYPGIICVPFILLGLIFNLNRKNLHFYLTVIFLLFFSMGTLISSLCYFCWPMMKYFRHLILVSPIIKVFLCFLAGFGFDAVFCKTRWKHSSTIKILLAIMAIFMFGMFLTLQVMSRAYPNNYEFLFSLIESMVPKYLSAFRILFNDNLMPEMFHRVSLFALTSSGLFAVFSFINRQKYFFPLAILLLTLHTVDVLGFKFSELRLKTASLDNKTYQITEFQSIPYDIRRAAYFGSNNNRAELLNVLPIKYGSIYWSTHAFLFKDELGSPFRTDHSLLPLDTYMRAYWGQPVHNMSMGQIPDKPYGLLEDRLEFPQGHPAIFKISGVDVVSSDDIIVAQITSNEYKGDSVFLSPPVKNKATSPVIQSEFKENKFASHTRLRLPYQVKRFDSNNIEITVNINDLASAWLLYSDVWHPFWRATVNGKEKPVYKANLAYKAVKLEKGANEVHFYFKSGLLSGLYFVFGLNALFWLIVIIGMAGKIVCSRRFFREVGNDGYVY